MKKLSFILLTFVFIFSSVFAQKANDHRVRFDYPRLPLKPLDKSIKNYQVTLLSWEDEAAVSQQAQYEAELEVYRENYKIAKEQYKKELAEYNRKTRLEKVIDKELLDEQKPVFNPPPYPDFKDIPKSPDLEDLAAKYLTLDGYDKGNYNPVFITVELKSFEKKDPEKKTKTTGSGENQKTTTSYYTKYKIPVKLTIEDVVNGVIFDNVLPISTDFYTYKSSTEPSFEEVKKFATNDLLSYTGKYINSNYGKTKMNLSTTVMVIQKYKKHRYPEMEEALPHALSGYRNIYLDKAKSISSFNKAINIWEKLITQYNPNNKKAKMNREATWYTMLNIAEAYLWIDNFDKSEEYLSRMEAVMPKWSTKARFKDTRDRLQNHRERFLANQ